MRNLFYLFVAAAGLLCAVWVHFLVGPHVVAWQHDAELVSFSAWPSGITRYPCANGTSVAFIESSEPDGVSVRVIRERGDSVLVPVSAHILDGVHLCRSGLDDKEVFLAWGAIVQSEGGALLPQLLVSVTRGNSAEDHIFDLPALPQDAVVGAGMAIVVLPAVPAQTGIRLAVIDFASQKLVELEAREAAQLLSASGSLFAFKASDGVFLRSKDEGYKILALAGDISDVALYENAAIVSRKSEGGYSIRYLDVDSGSQKELARYPEEPRYLSASNRGFVWVVRSEENAAGDICILVPGSGAARKALMSSDQRYPALSGEYLYWEESVPTIFGDLISFLSRLGLPVWNRFHLFARPERESHVFRRPLKDISWVGCG